MTLTTPVDIAPACFDIRYSDPILMLGSCFADAMGDQMSQYYFRSTVNPFGTLFNPLSIASAMTMTTLPEPVEYGGLWHLMSHHGSFSSVDRSAVVKAGDKAVETLQQAIQSARVIIITFGTAWVYEYDGVVVANCHKLPADRFQRRRLTANQILDAWQPIVDAYPDVRFIFTVSPIRHVRDGLHDNSLSKAVLLEAVDQLCHSATGQGHVTYFPSYEIVMDELRDYRFYADDLVHPSTMAIQYIWERFVTTYMTAATRAQMQLLHQFYLDCHHKPLHPDSAEYKAFEARLAETLATLRQRYPWINR